MPGPGIQRLGAARSRLAGPAAVAERYPRIAKPAVRGMAGVAVTAAGYALEYLMAAGTGRRPLGVGARHAEDR